MKTLHIVALSSLLMLSVSCRDDSKFGEAPVLEITDEGDAPVVDEPTDGPEQYRPQIHFTPNRNWMNDPNGMVKVGDTYHLFYQYNPSDNNWGNLSWGHATSKDLFNWEEQEVALRPDELGMIFSGCAVVDENNTAGFGVGAVVAFYTSSGDHQQQSLAYSTDGGMHFTKYASNPVIANTTMPDFRDPKVFWHAESQRWVMCLAKGWSFGVDIYTSADLKAWQYQSTFTVPVEACNKGQWECPDLIRMNCDGAEKWVMIVSVNPAGPAGGSGTMYFVGQFDGTKFTADSQAYPMWLDYGPDNYAGVTWSNTGDRHLLIGWMNNWNYAGSSPCSPWRSAMTLPRELGLANVGGQYVLTLQIAKEIDNIAGEWADYQQGSAVEADAYQINLKFRVNELSQFSLSNGGEGLVVEVKPEAGCLLIKRNSKTGRTDFAGNFSLPAIRMPLTGQGDEVELNIYVDQSSVEILTADGLSCSTQLVYPGSIYDRMTYDGTATAQYRTFQSVRK